MRLRAPPEPRLDRSALRRRDLFTYADCVEAVASGLAARGLTRGNVGMERWTVAPGAPLVAAIADAIGAAGADVVAGDWVVDRVRAVKTEPSSSPCVGRRRSSTPHSARSRSTCARAAPSCRSRRG